MNSLSFLLLFCIVTIACNSSQQEDYLQIKASITRKVRPQEINLETGNFYFINVAIINNSDSVISFWKMNCSWASSYTYNREAFVLIMDCPSKNELILEKLEPKNNYVYSGVLGVIDTTYIGSNKSLKLGFILIQKNEIQREIDFTRVQMYKKLKNRDIFWSNSFYLDK